MRGCLFSYEVHVEVTKHLTLSVMIGCLLFIQMRCSLASSTYATWFTCWPMTAEMLQLVAELSLRAMAPTGMPVREHGTEPSSHPPISGLANQGQYHACSAGEYDVAAVLMG